jgi:hypothetical protein
MSPSPPFASVLVACDNISKKKEVSTMPDYPVRLPRDQYRGKSARRQRQADRYNDLAESIERYLNRTVEEEQEEGTEERYPYIHIATYAGVNENVIYKMLSDLTEDFGSYDVRVYKPLPGEKQHRR